MLRLKEQLKDPIFRKWFATPPKKRPDANTSPPWFVYVQKKKGGPWQRAEVKTYSEGYKFIAKNLNKYHDLALSHKRRSFKPPVVKQRGKRRYHLPGVEHRHHWCPYCRRMTLFKRFNQHHAMPKWAVGVAINGERRCSICGIRLEAIERY